MKVFVTGAGGLIGHAVVTRLLERGHTVTALVRSSGDISLGHPSLSWVLGDVRDVELLRKEMRGSEYVVHLAARIGDEPDSRQVNVEGTKNVLSASETNDIKRLVHISTISTKFAERGLYADTKYEADTLVAKSPVSTVTLKFSLVYGDFEKGRLGALARFARLGIVPLIGPGRAIYRPVYVDDAAEAIEHALSATQTKSVFEVGGPEEVSLTSLVDRIAREGLGKRAWILHIPLPIGFFLARVFSFLPRSPITRGNIIGMNESVDVDPDPFNAAFPFRPRAFSEGIRNIVAKAREREKESFALMRYVSRGMPDEYYVELYEKALKAHGLTNHTLDRVVFKNAILLGALDAITHFTRPEGVFRKKLAIASAIYEASPPSSTALLPRQHSLVSIFFTFLRVGVFSTFKVVLGLLLVLIPNLHARNA